MSKYKMIFLLYFFIFKISLVFANSTTIYNLKIKQYKWKITQNKTIEKILYRCSKQKNKYKNILKIKLKKINEIIELSNYEIKECLKNSSLFKTIKITIKPYDIEIETFDRWHIIPIIGYSFEKNSNSEQTEKYRLFLVDTNFLGLGYTTGFGLESKEKKIDSFYFATVNKYFTKNTDLTLIIVDRRNIKNFYVGDKIIDTINENIRFVSANLSYFILQNWNINFLTSVYNARFNKIKNYSDKQTTSILKPVTHLSIGFGFGFNKTIFDFYENIGFQFQTNIFQQYKRWDNFDLESGIELTAKNKTNYWKRFSLLNGINLQARSQVNDNDPFRPGATKGYRGIPDDGVWTRNNIASYNELQYKLYENHFARFNLAFFFDIGNLQTIKAPEFITYQAYGSSLYLYLRTINFPALSIDYGKNDTYKDNFLSLRIGFDF